MDKKGKADASMIKKYCKSIMDYNLPLQERMFRLITGENIENLLIMTGCFIFVVLTAVTCIKKN